MKSVLVIYYSQSGEVERVTRRFTQALEVAPATLTVARLAPRVPYPYPWRSIRRFFDAMPECVLGLPPPIEEPAFPADARFDLVLIVYPVWFLSPAPPVQAFFGCAHAAVLRDTDVVTVLVCRAMWHRASERMKQLLAAAGARLRDNAVVTHQGSSLLTLVSTPRALLFGRQDRFLGVFPRPGVADDDLDRIDRLARALADGLGHDNGHGPLLAGRRAVQVRRWLIVPEWLGGYAFQGWARLVRALGRGGAALRALGVYGFAVFLVSLITLALPVVLLATLVARPALASWIDERARRLAAPTGETP